MFAGKAWMDKWDRGGEAWEGDRKEFFFSIFDGLFLLEGDGQ